MNHLNSLQLQFRETIKCNPCLVKVNGILGWVETTFWVMTRIKSGNMGIRWRGEVFWEVSESISVLSIQICWVHRKVCTSLRINKSFPDAFKGRESQLVVFPQWSIYRSVWTQSSFLSKQGKEHFLSKKCSCLKRWVKNEHLWAHREIWPTSPFSEAIKLKEIYLTCYFSLSVAFSCVQHRRVPLSKSLYYSY